jgi:hypothetical protein
MMIIYVFEVSARHAYILEVYSSWHIRCVRWWQQVCRYNLGALRLADDDTTATLMLSFAVEASSMTQLKQSNGNRALNTAVQCRMK